MRLRRSEQIDTLTRRAGFFDWKFDAGCGGCCSIATQTELCLLEYGVSSADVSRGFYQALSAGARTGAGKPQFACGYGFAISGGLLVWRLAQVRSICSQIG